MYYICDWYDYYIIFDDSTEKMAREAKESIKDAINSFKEDAWNIKTQPKRNIHIDNYTLCDMHKRHSVYFKTNNLDISYIIENYPEYLI